MNWPIVLSVPFASCFSFNLHHFPLTLHMVLRCSAVNSIKLFVIPFHQISLVWKSPVPVFSSYDSSTGSLLPEKPPYFSTLHTLFDTFLLDRRIWFYGFDLSYTALRSQQQLSGLSREFGHALIIPLVVFLAQAAQSSLAQIYHFAF